MPARFRSPALWPLLLLAGAPSPAQEHYLPLGRECTQRYAPWLYRLESEMHTAVQPYLSSDVRRWAPVDSLDSLPVRDNRFTRSWTGRKLLSEHLLQVDHPDYTLYLDPAFEFSLVNDRDKDLLYVNTRGVRAGGTLGERFSFQSSFYESQARFPTYIDSMVRATRVVPGGARIKRFNESFDYNIASGTISYSLKRHFNFQLGHDKVFIGDGYRSLLLSDNAFNFPFLKITTTFWRIRYVNLYTVFQDMQVPVKDFEHFHRKHGSFHFLDLRIGRRASVGILEAIIWKSDTARDRGFDINYLNPFVFLRPVEFSLGSPDNALLGFNFKYKITGRLTAFAQLLLDEFKIDEVRAGNGWWANKQAVQFGLKYFDAGGIRNLYVHTECNYVRPYTYQHVSSLTAYAHYNQPITHPLGANFWESVSIVRYQFRRFGLRAQFQYAKVGYDPADSAGQPVNYGQNVFQSYETRALEYGNEVGQGLETTLVRPEATVSYLINPRYQLQAEAGAVARISKNALGREETLYLFIGLRTALTNRYFDF
jgi:hypothetical protein